jgi:hypothetical protein
MPEFSSDSEGGRDTQEDDEDQEASPSVSDDDDKPQLKKHKAAAAATSAHAAGSSKQQDKKKAGAAAGTAAGPPAPVVSAEARQAALQALKLKRARGLGGEAGPATTGTNPAGLSGPSTTGASGNAGVTKSAAAGVGSKQLSSPQQQVLGYPAIGNGQEGGQEEMDGGVDGVGAAKKRRLVRAGAVAQVLTRPTGKENSAPVAAGDVDMGLEDF